MCVRPSGTGYIFSTYSLYSTVTVTVTGRNLDKQGIPAGYSLPSR